jgi:hypothetical protein
MVFFTHAILSRHRLQRRQPAVLMLGFGLPFVWNAMFLLKPDLFPAFDYNPAVFALGELVAAYGFFRFRMFSLLVVAHDTLVENMSDGLVVLDENSIVVT